uniref:Uncharacterized protein n=1 Tax=Arundo donax TaxID=35708 RepID=A0A0A9D838_ARUDO
MMKNMKGEQDSRHWTLPEDTLMGERHKIQNFSLCKTMCLKRKSCQIVGGCM